MPFSPDRDRTLTHAREPKTLSRRLRLRVHSNAVVRDGQRPMRRLINHGDTHYARMGMSHGVAHCLLGNAQQLVFVFGTKARRDVAAFERAGNPPWYRGALSQLS